MNLLSASRLQYTPYISRIHFESTIYLANSLFREFNIHIHYLIREFTLNPLFRDFILNVIFFREFTVSEFNKSIRYLFREFSLNSVFYSRFHSEFTISIAYSI